MKQGASSSGRGAPKEAEAEKHQPKIPTEEDMERYKGYVGQQVLVGYYELANLQCSGLAYASGSTSQRDLASLCPTTKRQKRCRMTSSSISPL